MVDLEKLTADEVNEVMSAMIRAIVESMDLEKFRQNFLNHYQKDNSEEVLAELTKELGDRDTLYMNCDKFLDEFGFEDILPEESKEG